MKEKTQAMQIRLPVELYAIIKEVADKERRSINSQIVLWLETHLATHACVTEIEAAGRVM
jgi:hypothetical protein